MISMTRIGDTIHSGPSLAVQEAGKDEGIGCSSDTVFPSDSQPSTSATLHPSQSYHTPQLFCQATPPLPQCALAKNTATPGSSLPLFQGPHHSVPSIIVTEASEPEDPESDVVETQATAHTTTAEVTVYKSIGLENSTRETDSPYVASFDALVDTVLSQDKVTKVCVSASSRKSNNQAVAVLSKPLGSDIPKEQASETAIPQEVKETVLEENITAQDKDVKSVEEAAIPLTQVVEVITPDVVLNEPTLPEVAQAEAALPELTETKLVITKTVKSEAVNPTTAFESTKTSPRSFAIDPSSGHQTSLSATKDKDKEMVRLIQEGDAKLDSFYHKRSSRASKRINSADFDHVLEVKSEPVSRAKRCTRTRKSSCRSDKSESEASDSHSVADESPYFDMVDKTAKQGKPKNGEPLLDEAATQISAKYNGDVSTELVNGVHKVKGRRVSRANSDESDCSSASKSNGNVEQNGDKIDFSVLLELSPADRENFESKKAKIRRKTADWLLISETEQYYNEKEEIMRNKNKLDSDSDSDESDDGTENNDSKSDCSDESESTDNISRGRSKGKGKPLRTIDEDSRPIVKRLKDEACLTKKQSRPIGSRNRKTRYDLTMLNDDDDDDENFFGFPISTTIPQGNPGVSNLSCVSHSRGRGKAGCKRSLDGDSGESCPSSSSGKAGRKRLSDAERFLRDNREYYHFQETPERLRRTSSITGGEKDRPSTAREDEDSTEPEKKEECRPKVGPVNKRLPTIFDSRRRVTRSTGPIPEETEELEKEKNHRLKNLEKADMEKDISKVTECARKKISDDQKSKGKYIENDKTKPCDENEKKFSEYNKANSEDDQKLHIEVEKLDTEDEKEKLSDDNICLETEDQRKHAENCSSKAKPSENGDCIESRGEVLDDIEARLGLNSELHGLYFSFEGIPEQESWFQTYQRLIDGVSDNVFFYEEDPLKFVLPYEMPREYVRDFLCYKKGLLSKKTNDLADLVRKSPRCHPSTLALFSDIIPTKKTKSVKSTKSTPVRVDEASSDGTSTPGADSTRMQPPESFETTEELAILALHIDHIMQSEIGVKGTMSAKRHSLTEECKESEDSDLKKTPPKKRGKKKRLLAVSKPDKTDGSTKELKLFENPLAQEVDPVFIAGLCDDMKDFLIPENILAREASEVIEDSFFCVCTDRASCDEFSSADDNTEASSECVSLCDSETIDGSVVSEPKPTRSAKKRRKNMTGWPKAQKKKRPVPSHTSDDNDSAIGWDDLEPKKQGRWKKHNFSLLEQTTSERLAALAACDRRASPRKKASVLYMDTWPVRFRTQK